MLLTIAVTGLDASARVAGAARDAVTCPLDPSWTVASIACRLESLSESMASVADAGLRASLSKAVDRRALPQLRAAGEASSQGDSDVARRRLGRAIRSIISFEWRVGSLAGRRRLDPVLAQQLRDAAVGLLADMRELRDRQYHRKPITNGAVHLAHQSDTSRCVDRLEAQFGPPPRLDIDQAAAPPFFELPDPTSGIYGIPNHNQGVGWFADVEIEGARYARSILSFTSNDGTGIMVAARALEGETEGFFSDADEVDFDEAVRIVDVVGVPELGNHDHAGGLQAHGSLAAIAMDNPLGPDDRAAVYFWRMDGLSPVYVQSVFVGGGPDDDRISPAHAAAAGFVRLRSGRFLLAVGGNHDSRDAIWFYVSTDDAITSETEWLLVDVWEPTRLPGGLCDIEEGQIGDDCFAGASGLNLVTACDGTIYLVAMHGTAFSGFDKEDEYLQVLKLAQDEKGRVVLQSVVEQKRIVGLVAIDDFMFRWASGAQVTNDGRIVLLATERNTALGTIGRVDGWMRIGVPAGASLP